MLYILSCDLLKNRLLKMKRLVNFLSQFILFLVDIAPVRKGKNENSFLKILVLFRFGKSINWKHQLIKKSTLLIIKLILYGKVYYYNSPEKVHFQKMYHILHLVIFFWMPKELVNNILTNINKSILIIWSSLEVTLLISLIFCY